MHRKTLSCIVSSLLVVALAPCSSALGQGPGPVHFRGLINDYSPSTVKGGPWEMHGTWTMDLTGLSGTANFSAVMTMSDDVIKVNNVSVIDPTQPGQNAHTHNIQLTNATVTWNMDGCPAFSPSTKMGFQINGTVSLLTGNGTNAPFETTPPSSTLQVCVTGGYDIPYSVPFSNITLVFSGPATSHFGTQAIHGVVRTDNTP